MPKKMMISEFTNLVNLFRKIVQRIHIFLKKLNAPIFLKKTKWT
jgi:hypothetical protein